MEKFYVCARIYGGFLPRYVMLCEYDHVCDEERAWRDAMRAVDAMSIPLHTVELYDTRLHHRAVWRTDRYRDDATLIAPAGWYNARSPYAPAGGSWTACDVEEV